MRHQGFVNMASLPMRYLSGKIGGAIESYVIEKVVPLEGLEPTTPSLRMMCSTS